jgi:tetratricopeptide (TPR) repeat protein
MNKRIIDALALALLVLLLGISSSYASYCPGAEPEPPGPRGPGENWYHYEQGMRMVDAGNWGQALREFNYYITHPQYHYDHYGIAYYGIAIVNQKRGNLEGAMACYNLAIKNDHHATMSVADKAYMNMGAIHLKNNDFPKAIENYNKAIDKDPTSGVAHYFLGMAYVKSGNIAKAEQESVEAKKLGVAYTALDEHIAEAKNPQPAKTASDEGKKKKTKKKKKGSDDQ